MRVTLILLLFSLPLFSSAQFEKGTKRIGADGMINYYSSGRIIQQEGLINLGYGYFINRQLVIGLQVGIDYLQANYGSVTTFTTSYSSGINARGYLPFGDGKYGLFVQGQWIYDYIKSGYAYNTGGYHKWGDNTDYRIGLSPGMFLFINQSNAIEVQLGYIYYLSGINYSHTTTGINWTSSSFLIGYHHYFNFPKTEIKSPTKLRGAIGF